MKMLKIVSPVLISVFLINSCGYTQTIDTKRKTVIEKAIAAIVKYDTTSLFSLVDTSFYFDIYGKESFIYKIGYFKNQMKTCQTTSVTDSLITQKERPVHTTEYTLSFCRFKNNNVNPDRFDLLFLFPNYEDETKILTIDVKTYKKIEIKPAVPVLKPNEN